MTTQVLWFVVTMTTQRPAAAPVRPARRAPRSLTARMWALTEVRWAAVAAALFAAGGTAQLGGASAGMWWALYLACYVTGGWEPALAGLRALRNRTLDADLLMIVAAIGAAAIGQVYGPTVAERAHTPFRVVRARRLSLGRRGPSVSAAGAVLRAWRPQPPQPQP
jgi:cation transport ATPase